MHLKILNLCSRFLGVITPSSSTLLRRWSLLFEIKIIRMVFGPNQENEEYYNHELQRRCEEMRTKRLII